tara:strand:- start:438 stop:1286 length:849 start_codon:yes stop_codon:yes gene_type:complete
MCGTCGCKSAESGKKNCGCGQDPCITFGAESYSDEVKAKVFDSIFEWHEQMQLQGEGIEYELDRMRWMLENPDKGYDDYPYTYEGQLREGFDAENTCASCGEGIDEDDIIGDGTNRGLCCVPDYYDDESEMVNCSFCSKIIGTEKEVYDEETIDYEVANGETICVSCGEEREKELKNDLDPHYSPFYAEYEDCEVCYTTVDKGTLNDVQAGRICDECHEMNQYAGGTGRQNNPPFNAETEKPFWENITMSSKKKKEISPLYQGLIASGLVIVALRIMDKVKK